MTSFYNSFQNSLLQYAGYTGTTGGIQPPVSGGGGLVQYYTGATPVSVTGGTITPFSLTLQGQVGDFFTMFFSGQYDGSAALITPNIAGSGYQYVTGNAGGSYVYEITLRVLSDSDVWITAHGYSSTAISAVSPQQISTVFNTLAAGTRSMNVVAGVPMTVSISDESTVSLNSFSIMKYSSA